MSKSAHQLGDLRISWMSTDSWDPQSIFPSGEGYGWMEGGVGGVCYNGKVLAQRMWGPWAKSSAGGREGVLILKDKCPQSCDWVLKTLPKGPVLWRWTPPLRLILQLLIGLLLWTHLASHVNEVPRSPTSMRSTSGWRKGAHQFKE